MKKFLKECHLPLFLDFFRWVVIDFYRAFKYGIPLHLFGIYAFVGQYGGGKTMGVTMHLDKLRSKYKDNIYIFTNYYYYKEDAHLDDWKMLLQKFDKPAIFVFDEIQNVFNSRNYKAFPMELMGLLTQNRKGHGKQILYTAQDYETVDKNFRRLTKKVVTCRTIKNRLTSLRYYLKEDYDDLITVTNVRQRMKIHPLSHLYKVQSDEVRKHFNSFQYLDEALDKEYMDRDELNNIKSVQ